MPLISQVSHDELLPSTSVQLKPRAPAVKAPPDRVTAAKRIVEKRLRDPQPKACTAQESWTSVLDRCAKDFGKRRGLSRYLAAVDEGRKRKRRPPVVLWNGRPHRHVQRLGMRWHRDGTLCGPLVQDRGGACALSANGHRGLLVALEFDVETAAQLAIAGGEAPEDLHVTLCYCQSVDDLGQDGVARAVDVVKAVVAAQPPLRGRVNGMGRFNASETSDGLDVIWASVDVPGLSAFREQLAAALRDQAIVPSEVHGFTPHCTLAYVAPGVTAPTEVPSLEVGFGDVTITAGDAWYVVPFGGADA